MASNTALLIMQWSGHSTRSRCACSSTGAATATAKVSERWHWPRHEAIWRSYRFPVSEFPAKIILPSNLGEGVPEAWLEILPYAEIEFTRSYWADMLARPAVKRVVSILSAVASPQSSED